MNMIMYSVNSKFPLISRSSETVRASKQQAAESRERVIDAAAKLFREKGFDGIGVDDLMMSAGLTHGGFYRHFSSKEELISEASERAMGQSLDNWRRVIEQDPDNALDRLTKNYLAPTHRDTPGLGCFFAALGTEVARQQPPVRRAVTAGLGA
jgi:TetR/AcrR family transcriptional repressor of nem operon